MNQKSTLAIISTVTMKLTHCGNGGKFSSSFIMKITEEDMGEQLKRMVQITYALKLMSDMEAGKKEEENE